MPADTKNPHAAEPNGQTPPGAATDPVAALFSFWGQWMEQSARGSQAMIELVQKAGDPQQFQRQWLDAVARSLDEFMRTPAFLDAMKRNLKTITDLKVLQGQVVGGAAHQLGMPLAEDITGVSERLRGAELAIVGRLKAIEDRLKAMEAKLGTSSSP
jgi:hypothetical protein